MKPVKEYNVTDHGVDNCQMFQGHGIALTEYEDCATGCGDTYNEAFEDALESLAQAGWETATIVNEDKDNPKAETTVAEWLGLPDECPNDPNCDGCEDCQVSEEMYYYVSIDVK